MSIFQQVRDQVDSADWRYRYNDDFVVSPSDTYKQIIASTFAPVEDSWRTVNQCSLSNRYQPCLGEFRRSKNFSSLAPSNAIPLEDRQAASYFGSSKIYKPKGKEWKLQFEHSHSNHQNHRKTPIYSATDLTEGLSFESRKLRRCMSDFPTSTSRIENYNLYLRGRLDGVFGTGALYYPSNFEGREDRRYNRIYWSQNWLNHNMPTARHSTSLLLAGY